ncbi:O-antigen ligase family protein [Clostridium magnum]|uniref:O-antigen ligase n=1 Tax=Clostridium magnum DSM 2767 TaxID=1121326 RepID=A0A161YRV9_9CLOT|nr:O-antigen ligase family protein [Clostridium magnum]KZL93732.1 O-antigen ligase [Clostridium magnum DSM 2767]SHI09650.1 O-antigen ligase [Clostridium magnum DSM 2767]
MFLHKISYCLICLYIIILPLIRSEVEIAGQKLADVILALIILSYLVQLVICKESISKFIDGIKDFFTSYLSIFMSILALMMLISVSYAVDKSLALSESIRFIVYIIIYFIIKYDLNSKKCTIGMIKSYIFSTLILCLFGVYQYFTGYGLEGKFRENYGYLRYKITANMDNPNNLAAFLILAIFPMIMLAIYEKEKIKKIFYIILSTLIFTNLILTGSRNAIIGIMVGVVILAIVYSFRLVILMALLGGISIFIPVIRTRLMAITDKTQNESRVYLWEIAKKMIKDHPLFGVGNGNYATLHDKYTEIYPQFKFYMDIKATHNSYLKIESELGIIGGISFIGILISALIQVKKFISTTQDEFYKFFYTGFLASMISFYVMNISDNLFFVPKTTSYFWILLAISQGIMFRVKSNKSYLF